ncbi:MAG: adenylate/guanylate cyclase domain-containing protein [Candidatus Eremiobacteraeota bacterium]|nr:adenylate/guanylate cyclase domain-containing protein [Candidatus Eremiobacteraeota bacterium]
MSAPADTVTFLFSDIEGSTARWEAHRDAMQSALARHDAVMRAALERHGGHVFKTIGDAFCCAFSKPQDAAAAAVDAQRALAECDWSAVDGLRVRMAMHTGVAERRDDDYFGPPLNRVARMMSAAHGAQILVSHVAAALLEGTLAPGASLRDLGKYRLKDLPEPEHVFQLDGDGLLADFPPLRAVEENPTNLPLHLTALLGRQRELADIEALVRESRLVTLTGSGGVGKTRTALEAARDSLDTFADGVWLVELAPIAEAALIAGTIAAALRVSVTSGGLPPLEELALAIRNKTLLVVLDNCEHLIAGAAQTVEQLLQRCPGVHFLVTSREALGVHGERTYRMPSLDETSGAALFAERAAAVKRDFALNGNAAIVNQIVTRLDGIPLAIELAASRVKVLSLERIREGLNERFKLLAGGSRTALPRQQTLRAMIGWSYELLDDAEKRMLRQLAIFRAGWTIDAAVEVSGDGENDAIALLESLVEKSLVNVESDGSELRYRLLESTREFAAQELRERGEYAATAARHCAFFLGESRRRYDEYWRLTLDRWHAAMAVEFDNFRAAIDWALVEGFDPVAGASIVANLSETHLPERRHLTDRAMPVAENGDEALGAHLGLAYARIFGDSRPVEEAAQRAARYFKASGDAVHFAEATIRIGGAYLRQGRVPDAIACAEEALAALEGADAPALRAWANEQLALWTTFGGDPQAGCALFERTVESLRRSGDYRRLRLTLGNFAEALFASGNVARAVECLQESFDLNDPSTTRERRQIQNLNLAAYLLALDRAAEARDCAIAALDVSAPDEELLLAVGIGHLAEIAARRGDPESAARAIGFSDAVYARQGAIREPTEARGYQRAMEILRSALDKERLTSLMAEGGRTSRDQAVHEARAATE